VNCMNRSNCLILRYAIHDPLVLKQAFELLKAAVSLDTVKLELEVLTLNLLSNLNTKNTLSLNPPPWLLRAQEMIADLSDQDLGIADIADTIGVHRVYLARTICEASGLYTWRRFTAASRRACDAVDDDERSNNDGHRAQLWVLRSKSFKSRIFTAVGFDTNWFCEVEWFESWFQISKTQLNSLVKIRPIQLNDLTT